MVSRFEGQIFRTCFGDNGGQDVAVTDINAHFGADRSIDDVRYGAADNVAGAYLGVVKILPDDVELDVV